MFDAGFSLYLDWEGQNTVTGSHLSHCQSSYVPDMIFFASSFIYYLMKMENSISWFLLIMLLPFSISWHFICRIICHLTKPRWIELPYTFCWWEVAGIPWKQVDPDTTVIKKLIICRIICRSLNLQPGLGTAFIF